MITKTNLLLPTRHHSTADWDKNTSLWQLDPTTFVTAPSSLKFLGSTGLPRQRAVLCRDAATQAVREGRLVTYAKRNNTSSANHFGFIFRAQAGLGSGSPNNSYYVRLFHTGSWIYIDAGGVENPITIITTPPMSSTVWNAYRITWWEGYDLQNEPATILRVEYFDDGWQQAGDDYYDVNRRNEGSATNRCGITGYSATSANFQNFDETEIWTP